MLSHGCVPVPALQKTLFEALLRRKNIRAYPKPCAKLFAASFSAVYPTRCAFRGCTTKLKPKHAKKRARWWKPVVLERGHKLRHIRNETVVGSVQLVVRVRKDENRSRDGPRYFTTFRGKDIRHGKDLYEGSVVASFPFVRCRLSWRVSLFW